jgi:hypothetical protein
VKESSHVSPRSPPAMLGAGSGVAATNVFATLHKTNLKSESTRNRIRTYRCRVANAAALDSACQQGRSFPLLFVKMDWDEWAGKARLLGNTFSSLPSMDIHIQKPFIATPPPPVTRGTKPRCPSPAAGQAVGCRRIAGWRRVRARGCGGASDDHHRR